MTMLSDAKLIDEIVALGVVRDVELKMYQTSATFARFLHGTMIESGAPCFIKCTIEKVDKVYGDYPYELESALAGAKYARTIHTHHMARLSDGSWAISLSRAYGVTLQEVIDRKLEISEKGKLVISSALLEFAEALGKCSFTHCDICPKNLIFNEADETLTLIDFDTAVRSGIVSVSNPSVPAIQNWLLLNYGYYPVPGVWNDIHSLAKVHENVLGVSSLDLLNLALKARVSTVNFGGDDNWRRRIRWAYLKLSARPLWTHKKNSRFKKAALLKTLRQIINGV